MDKFYNKLEEFKTARGLNYKQLGEIIGKSESAMRMAVKRRSLTLLEEERLEKYFASGAQNEKTPPEEVRFEELVAKKVHEILAPILEGYTENIIKSVMNLHLELNEIKIRQEEILESQESCSEDQKETRKVLEIIEKKF